MTKKKQSKKTEEDIQDVPYTDDEQEGGNIMYSLQFFKTQGKLGGQKGGAEGGKITAAKLSPAQRRAKAVKAAKARWAKEKSTE